jgi:hypothetical protein
MKRLTYGNRGGCRLTARTQLTADSLAETDSKPVMSFDEYFRANPGSLPREPDVGELGYELEHPMVFLDFRFAGSGAGRDSGLRRTTSGMYPVRTSIQQLCL